VDYGTRSPSLQGETLIAFGMRAQTASLRVRIVRASGAAMEAVCRVNPTVIRRKVPQTLLFCPRTTVRSLPHKVDSGATEPSLRACTSFDGTEAAFRSGRDTVGTHCDFGTLNTRQHEESHHESGHA
jgi:hypothetical protein